ncbi:hypothetical protein KHA94_05135 [Bacillus sp. FJAT-49705]|uniref:Uncharacterized protein n=1 Tax=Cytobacillus citreus TaxID=2833586 RepID=A0ABS5NP39_9BACI|nr:hypothetical protein [Cytobacillus citreus]MBS4189595.1 hypothetical protein [Cytobacillus citreus]
MKKQSLVNKRISLAQANKAQKFPNHNNDPGESINEHRAIEFANVLISEKELGQQNENL